MIFQSTPSVGRTTSACTHPNGTPRSFQSTPSVGRTTRAGKLARAPIYISIHALRGEDDTHTAALRKDEELYFNPRPPWGGRRAADGQCCGANPHFNPRPPWGGRPCVYPYTQSHYHAFQSTPSVGRTTTTLAPRKQQRDNFNPRPPWGGRRRLRKVDKRNGNNFNPRPPWGGRPASPAHQKEWVTISIHALRGEDDTLLIKYVCCYDISIHALRGEDDKLIHSKRAQWIRYFNPRPPWGGRRSIFGFGVTPVPYFNPRPPWGGRPMPSLQKS